MKAHLCLFTLGPVQGFIAQARKVHDLYSGSKILSELCKFAAERFKEQGGEVIFPYICSEDIPNRFLGKITTDSDLASIGKSVEDAVQDYWRMQFKELIAKPLGLNGSVYREAKRQIEQHLDIQWLFQPLPENYTDEDYRKAYDELNKNLNAIKNTRPFFTPEEKGRKYSLDGERNVIFYRKTLKQQKEKTNDDLQNGNPLFSTDNRVFDCDDKDSIIKLRHLQPGEGLSAVSMLKRFKEFKAGKFPDTAEFEAGKFPDTAEFALADTMHQVGAEHLSKMIQLFGHDDPKHLDWQLFFEENLNERYFEKQGLTDDKNKLNAAKEIQEALAKDAKAHGRKLEKYYALVVFDGDHMGEWWKGARLKPGVKLEDFHKDLTKRLADFAKAVRAEYSKESRQGHLRRRR